MKNRIVLINFHCKDCECDINGTMNSPRQLINKDNGYSYTEIVCPYCKKIFYIKNQDGNPINAIGKLNPDDFLSKEDNPNFNKIGEDSPTPTGGEMNCQKQA